MEKSDTLKINVQVGRHYIYKGCEYVVKELTMVKNDVESVEKWKPGVVYGKVEANDAEPCVTHVRDIEDFSSKFIPMTLEIGDYVEVISMGKTKGYLVVSSINDEKEFPVQFENNDKISAKRNIDPQSLRIEVDKPEQSTDYRILMFNETSKDYHRMADESVQKILDLKQMINISNTNIISRIDARQTIIKVFKILKNNS